MAWRFTFKSLKKICNHSKPFKFFINTRAHFVNSYKGIKNSIDLFLNFFQGLLLLLIPNLPKTIKPSLVLFISPLLNKKKLTDQSVPAYEKFKFLQSFITSVLIKEKKIPWEFHAFCKNLAKRSLRFPSKLKLIYFSGLFSWFLIS